MPHIQQLDAYIADLIAAGEVVERTPANVPVAGDPMI
jgi:DNA mismatch repair ATPase MutL